MKIKEMLIKNFGAYDEFKAEFSDGITDIIGLNGSGKSTLIKSFLACFKGLNETRGGLVGKRYQFIGSSGKSAHIEYVLHDEILDIDVVITNHITKDTNRITFKAPEGSGLTEEWLENLFSVTLMSAKHFCSQTPKQQAMSLGINTEKFDKAIATLKADYTLLNRDLTNFGDLSTEPEKVEEVKVEELASELQTLRDIDQKHYDKTEEDWLDSTDTITNLKNDIVQLKATLKAKEDLLITAEADETEKAETLEKTENPVDKITKLQGELKTAGETNKKYNTWKTWDDDSKDKAKAKKLVDANKTKQAEESKLKVAYMKKFDFPFKGMAVDDAGGLTLKDRYFNYECWSQGEIELAMSKIAVWLNPELRVRMIDDASLLDAEKKESVGSELIKAGFQVIFFNVSPSPDKDQNVIQLHECRRVDSLEEEKDDLI